MSHVRLISFVIYYLTSSCLAEMSIEIPFYTDSTAIIHHAGFTLEYAEKYEQARWVAYMLSKERASGTITRTDKFRPDPSVLTGSATLADYKVSGYDRGHLFPAADAAYDSSVMHDCFYLSNMSPQTAAFNRGIWETLESQVRKWALEFDSIYVVTGGILRDGLPTIGADSVAVPEFYYKVILCVNDTIKSAIGFILKNEGTKDSLTSFAVTIDSVEHTTGIDFFPSLPDSIENCVESYIDTTIWLAPSSLVPMKKTQKPKIFDSRNQRLKEQVFYDVNGRKFDLSINMGTRQLIQYDSMLGIAFSFVTLKE